MAQVLGFVFIFLCYLSGINSNSWMTSPLPFSLMFLRVGGLGLRLISGKQRIVGLSLFLVPIGNLITLFSIGVVFVLLDQWFISFWAPGIDFLSPGGWLEAGFCFYIDSFLYHLVLCIQVLPLIVQLSLNRRVQAFSKVAYQGFLVERYNRANFLKTACKCSKCAVQSKTSSN